MPASDGPFPAVVLLHGCDGISPFLGRWADELVGWGYVALLVDSLNPRSVFNVCEDNPPLAGDRALDAFGALTFLRALPYVVAHRIAVMGWSHEGWTVLAALDGNGIGAPFSPGFRAGTALYPPCGYRAHLSAPLLILIGDSDEWTPAARCRAMLAESESQRREIEMIVYPGAHHTFDAAELREPIFHRTSYGRFRLQFDATADRDARRRVHEYLRVKLQ